MASPNPTNVQLVIKNVRSFVGTNSITIAPLTILVGENSAGKSTCLAMLESVLSGMFPFAPFGSPIKPSPFDLGGFSSVATSIKTRGAQVTEFSIGVTEGERGAQSFSEIVSSYVAERGRPTFSALSTSSQHGSLQFQRSGTTLTGTLSLRDSKFPQFALTGGWNPSADQGLVKAIMRTLPSSELKDIGSVGINNIINRIGRMDALPAFRHKPIHSLAPIRTSPLRLYGEIKELFSPEGTHTPLMLSQLLMELDPDGGQERAIQGFGEASGLFRKIEIQKLGREPNAPFRILLRMPGGGRVNLADVGYGVSQVLPVVVECLLMPNDAVVTVQQPEVHLHPRAQAELGSFFARFVASRPKTTLVIETHSDYLLDRVRKEVANGTLDPRFVSIVFLEKRKAKTRVHDIRLDEVGNLLNPPRSYRKFFLDEELSILSRGDR